MAISMPDRPPQSVSSPAAFSIHIFRPGYSEDDPQLIRARDSFEQLGIEEPPANIPSHLPHDP